MTDVAMQCGVIHELTHGMASLLTGWTAPSAYVEIVRYGPGGMATIWSEPLREAGLRRMAAIALAGTVAQLIFEGKIELRSSRAAILKAALQHERGNGGFRDSDDPSDMVIVGAALSQLGRDTDAAKYAVEVARAATLAVFQFVAAHRGMLRKAAQSLIQLPADGSEGLAYRPLALLDSSGGEFRFIETVGVSEGTLAMIDVEMARHDYR